MNYNENNTDFLSYQGRINRKNYIINMLILLSLYAVVYFIRFDTFSQYFSFGFFNSILMFLVEFFKFVIIVSIISVVYRRINDFSKFDGKIKNVFIIFYFVPFLYLSFGHYLLDFLPALINIMDMITLFILLPVAVILTIVFAFIKSR